MKGDILIIGEQHRKAARQIFRLIEDKIRTSKDTFFVTVAGESGAGKSEVAAALAENIEQAGHSVFVIQQDDFFVYPPKTNETRRQKNGGKVGPEEVHLDLMNEIVRSTKNGVAETVKPLVIFDEDRITEEKIEIGKFRVIIMEGTYTTMLENIDCKVFIDRNVYDTRADRRKRNREKQDDFLEKILLTEHKIISSHKPLADIIITRDYDAIKSGNDNE